jgi:dipeptidyl aminopeptidase/acylaminoacyl peptidase
MSSVRVAPYGSWTSPITTDLITAGTVSLEEIWVDGEDVYWIESRPSERGRCVVVRCSSDNQIVDMTPAPSPYSARTSVHEYGGGSFAVFNKTLYFANASDQRLYRQIEKNTPKPLTPESESQLRYADLILDTHCNRLICVREDHTAKTREPVNTIVGMKLGDTLEQGDVLVSGNDFYASPRLSPDGTQLAWLTWNHPNMPWDGTELWVGTVQSDGSLGKKEKIAGGPKESIFQPEWSPDGVLYFISDRTEWWNLYRALNGRIEPVTQLEAEFGRPQWRFRMSTYAFESSERIVASYVSKGFWHLAMLDTKTLKLQEITTQYSVISHLWAREGRAFFIGGAPTEPLSIVEVNLQTQKATALKKSSQVALDPNFASIPQAIEFPAEHKKTAHGFYYPPTNRDFTAPAGEKPPLIVLSHGGPTSTVTAKQDLQFQYWTSRGFALLDVNYGGSTGFGRSYRERLYGQWGVVDVQDCINGARYLIEKGLADANRVIIKGGSAGGYTTLCALTFKNFFKAGACYFGVSDLEALDQDTHKFESRYNHNLIGPYPEKRELYRARSPIHHAENLSCPIIFFQGLDDKVVPPNQSEMMVDILHKKKIPVAYLAFEGEGHGFRRGETIRRTLEAELYFYSKIFKFALAESVPQIQIENL